MFGELSLFRLKVFKEVVEARGFRAASESLNISQPAISAHIRALEKQTGIILLERGRQTKVTEAGQYFYGFAKRTLQEADETIQVISEMRNARCGRIGLGASTTLGRYVMPRLLSDFKKDNPGVEMILRLGTVPKICQLVLDREIDLGFVIGQSAMPGIVAQTVAFEELVIVTANTHPLAKKAEVSPEELSSYPFITGIKESSHNKMIEEALASRGIMIKCRVMELEDADSIKCVLKEGLGMGVLLRASVAFELQEGLLVKVNLAGSPIMIDLRLLLRADKHLSPVVNRFLQVFRSRIKDLVSPGVLA